MPTLIAAAFQPAFGCAGARLPFFLSDDLDFSAFEVGLTVAIASAVISLGLLVSARLARRWSSRRLIATGCLLMTVGLACFAVARSDGPPLAAAAGIIAIQSAFGFIVIPCMADALDTTDKRRLPASSLFGFVQPTVGGLAVAFSSTLGLSSPETIIVLSTISLVAIVTLLFLPRERTPAAGRARVTRCSASSSQGTRAPK